MLYCEIFGDVVTRLLARNLLFCSTLPLSKLAYPRFLCKSYSDPWYAPGSCLSGLGLDAVIDGTQTGARVRFDIREPPQQRARERVDRLIGKRGFIPFSNSWTL